MSKQRVYMDSNKFEPRGKLMLVKPGELKAEEVSESGLVISIRKESVIDRPSFGKVVAVGNEAEYNVGDSLFWPMTDGIDFEFDDGNFVLIRNESVIGKEKN